MSDRLNQVKVGLQEYLKNNHVLFNYDNKL